MVTSLLATVKRIFLTLNLIGLCNIINADFYNAVGFIPLLPSVHAWFISCQVVECFQVG